jgi:hypothetical protein
MRSSPAEDVGVSQNLPKTEPQLSFLIAGGKALYLRDESDIPLLSGEVVVRLSH